MSATPSLTAAAEVQLLDRLWCALRGLDADACRRVLAYLADRHAGVTRERCEAKYAESRGA